MSDTERLEAAAAALEQRCREQEVSLLSRNGTTHHVAYQTAYLAEDRAVAALLRAAAEEYDDLAPVPRSVFRAALAVADAVLGVPASPKTP